MSQTRLAVDGNTKSGVVVAQIRRSISAGAVSVLGKQPAHRLGGHVRGAEPLALEDAAFLDAGAFGDPGVAGVDHARESSLVSTSGGT